MSDPLAFGVDLKSVRDRLLAVGYFLDVFDMLDLADAMEEAPAIPPAAFVQVAGESAEPNVLIQGYRQRVTISLSVVFVESAARLDRTTKDKLERTRKMIIRQLIGWKPTGADKALEFDRYLLRAVGEGLVYGECLFRTSYSLTLAP